MLKKLSLIFLAVIFVASCGNKTEVTEKIPQLTIAQITANAAEYAGKEVALIGNVDHVCHHTGKRLFLSGDTPEERFKVTASDTIGTFDVELEGKKICVTGLLHEQRIDAAFLDKWESDLDETSKPEVGHEGHGASQLEDHHESSLDKINEMRKQLAESETGYLSFYSLECQSFKVL